MKQKHLRFGQIIASLALVVAGLSLFASCGKEKGVIASPSFSIADFVGTFIGASSCNTDTAWFTLNAGKDRTTVTTPAWFGAGQCRLVTNIDCQVSGNTLTIDSAYFQDRCFGDYYVDAAGTLINDSMFLTVYMYTPTGADTCFFAGRKIADTAATQLLQQ
jgi:hypothetical protein